MAKLSGLIQSGKLGAANPDTVAAMPDAPGSHSAAKPAGAHSEETKNLESKTRGLSDSKSVKVLDSETPTQKVDIELLKKSRFQVRAAADDEYIEALCESVRMSGVISPIVVRPIDGGYEIIAGHHRLDALKRLGHQLVTVQIRNLTDAEAAKALASDNFVRSDLTDYERFKHAKMLKDNGFCKTNREIALVLGRSSSAITQLNAFDTFPDAVKAMLEVTPSLIGADAAYKLQTIAFEQPDLFTEAMRLVAEGSLLQTKIDIWVNSKLSSAKTRVKRGYRSEVKIDRPGLLKPIKLTFTDTEAKIQAEGIDPEKLKKLIESNLDNLLVARS